MDVPASTLAIRGLSKRFGATIALEDVDLDVGVGEVVALVGDNGAGKSTLVRHVSGVYQPDSGSIYIDGKRHDQLTPRVAQESGIETIHQHFALVETLEVAANLFLNREILSERPVLRGLRWMDRPRMRAEAGEALIRFGLHPSVAKRPVSDLSGGQQQMVAIARAVHFMPRLIIMDEPTAALAVNQAEKVIQLIRSLSAEGIGVLLISHDMGHVLEVADRVIVLRHGRVVANLSGSTTTHQEIVMHITGHRD